MPALPSAFTLGLLSLGCGSETPHVASQAGSGSQVTTGGGAGASSVAGAPAVSGGVAGTSGEESNAGVATGGQAGAGTAGAGGAGAGGGAASGTAFKGVANSECADLERMNVAWWYNWVLSPGSCQVSEFVPMIAGKAEKDAAKVQSALASLKADGYRTVLGFNEPNKIDQSDLSVEQVLELWPALTSDPEVRVGSPATSADAQAWFEDFMTQVEAKQLRVDFVAIHWYGWNAGSCNDASELESYITWAEKFGRPIWITEFGCLNASNPSAEVVQTFYASALQAIARHPKVERYAWYPWTANNELVAEGSLTELGTAFAAAPAER